MLLNFLTNNKKPFAFVFIMAILVPVSIGYNGSSFVFDSAYHSGWKAIPLGVIITSPLLLFSAKQNLQINYKILLIIGASVSVSYLLANDIRTIIVGAQLILLISIVEALKWFFAQTTLEKDIIQEYMYFSIVVIVFLKFLTDIHHYYSLYMFQQSDMLMLLDHQTWGIFIGLYQNPFSNPAFINKQILIYDYFDYFQIIYIMGALLALKMYAKYPLHSIFLVLVLLLYIIHSTSRMWTIIFYSIPFLYFAKTLNIKYSTFFCMLLAGWVIIVTTAIMFHGVIKLDYSLNVRMTIIYEFFNELKSGNIIFPRVDTQMTGLGASLHNELLEVWFRCGVFSAITFWWWSYSNIKEVAKNDKFLSFLLLFILVPGGLIQLNYLHLYSLVVIGLFISSAIFDEEQRVQ